MRIFSQNTAGTVLGLLDVALAVPCWVTAIWLAHPEPRSLFHIPSDPRGVLYPLCGLLLLFAAGLYRRDAILNLKQSLTRVPPVIGLGAASAALTSVLCSQVTLPRAGQHDQIMLLFIAVVALSLAAFLARLILHVMVQCRVLRRRLLIIGAGRRAWELMLILGREGSSPDDDVTLVHGPSQPPVDERVAADYLDRIVRAPEFDILPIAREVGADLIVVAPDERRGMNLERLLACKRAGFPVIDYLSFMEREIHRIDLKRMELGWLIYSDGFTFSTLDRVAKRLFDLVISSVILLLTAPLILAGMVAIRLEGPGPVLYRQDRLTRDGKTFQMLKLRTMRVNAEAQGAVWAARNDHRITRAGRFLRRTRIDELPQLVNILRGDMSFVGPRPERPVFVKELATQIPLYHEWHMVKAGLTGWAQINYPYGASIDDARSKLSYDLYYVKNFSILFDFIILLQTLRVVLWPSGAR